MVGAITNPAWSFVVVYTCVVCVSAILRSSVSVKVAFVRSGPSFWFGVSARLRLMLQLRFGEQCGLACIGHDVRQEVSESSERDVLLLLLKTNPLELRPGG
uniref:(northern house mosquito) hypothetical protein n=1 Tax=Culex pipiens TaxID=7175 RepID=A0A8D8AFD3_CULPI